MKKLTKLLIVLISFTFLQPLIASENKAKKKDDQSGPFINVAATFPSILYGTPLIFEKSDLSSDVNKIGFALETGNLFQIAEIGSFGAFGVKATWFGLGFNKYELSSNSYQIVSLKALKPGLFYTQIIDKNISVDVAFQFAPSLLYDTGSEIFMLGIGKSTGITLRYSTFAVGLSYDFGTITDVDFIGKVTADNEKLVKYRTNSLAVRVGFKF
ncbi:MAG: hypothetical protein PF481_08625 [Bacteroidales bacterium]|jgi:hypothetical protein|nr:hypothetical protein [Bacteroidales bacterium]